ncbi:MAG: SPFH domain-containing protein [Oscillospiraceae bacterium]|jgi:hypothetical protein|nr:SPFH domain-containing protein [Oscillospiraceae bacterium]
MFGIHYIKFQPSEYVLRYKKGKLIAQGAGLSFYYFKRNTSLEVLPMGSIDAPFIFEEITADYQTVTVQGQLVFHIAEREKTASLLDYSINERGGYRSDDPKKLPQRLINAVAVHTKMRLEQMSLTEAMRSSEPLAGFVLEALGKNKEIVNLGLEILSLSVLSILPNKETARALEAQTREQLLKTADDAVYERRNASIEQERRVKENEYNTDISVENKKRQVRETQLEAEQAVQAKTNALKEEQLLSEIRLEEKRKELVELESQNAKAEADAKAYALSATMKALENVDPSVIQSLAAIGMEPGKLLAYAFQDLADNAQKIGQLNVTPDLLREIIQK